MKRSWLVLGLVLLATPCRAATFFEIGNVPTVSFGWENPKLALTLGLNARWSTLDVIRSGPVINIDHVGIVVLSPAATALFFLNQEPKAQGFLEMRAMKGLPIVSGNTFDKQLYEDTNDDWTLAVGGGLRSRLAEHLSVGGAADASFTLLTASQLEQGTNVTAFTTFRAFLQYHL